MLSVKFFVNSYNFPNLYISNKNNVSFVFTIFTLLSGVLILKKYGVVGSILFMCPFLSACGGGAKDTTEYIDVDFIGMDTNWVATYNLDEKNY